MEPYYLNWFVNPCLVLVMNNSRLSKYKDLIEEAELLQENSGYAWIQRKDGTKLKNEIYERPKRSRKLPKYLEDYVL